MGGILQVDTIQNNNATTLITQTNTTTLTFGVTGQNIVIPSGVTFNTASATVTVPPSIITGQTVETSVEGGDLVLLYDDSATALRKMTRTNLFSGVAVNGPAFSAFGTGTQSISSNVETKAALQSEEFDTNSNFDSTTNYRFTPTVAGYYQINGQIRITLTGTTTGFSFAVLYKNGSQYKLGNANNAAVSGGSIFSVSDIVFLNGSSDYIELFGNINGTSPSFFNNSSSIGCSMSGAMVRSA